MEVDMNYEDFCNKVKNAASELFGENTRAEITSVTKNNGLILKGLTIKHEDSRISPTVYLEAFYEMYESGTRCTDMRPNTEGAIFTLRSIRILKA